MLEQRTSEGFTDSSGISAKWAHVEERVFTANESSSMLDHQNHKDSFLGSF